MYFSDQIDRVKFTLNLFFEGVEEAIYLFIHPIAYKLKAMITIFIMKMWLALIQVANFHFGKDGKDQTWVISR